MTLVNINQLQPRTLLVQGGAYGEHEILAATTGGRETQIAGPKVRSLAGARIRSCDQLADEAACEPTTSKVVPDRIVQVIGL